MGILNLTPDSFSDGGMIAGSEAALVAARQMHADGAKIIDIGAESTRPGAQIIDAETEQARLLPVLETIVQSLPHALISVDTYRTETAILALEAGAHIINDVWGLQREPQLANAVASHGAGLVIMHTGRDREKQADPIEDQRVFLSRSLEIAQAAGIADDQIVLDPGFGFAKDTDDNLAILARFEALHELGFPILAGTSRKRFVGHVTGRPVDQRDVATAATTALLRVAGAAVLRVHDVAKNADALAIADAMLAASGKTEPKA